jgi:CRISPR-associated endonuclease Csn1
MGDEAKLKLRRFQEEREKARKDAHEQTMKLGFDGRSVGMRYQLWKAQGGICLYTGEPLMETKLADYEIDHIVPRSLGGPDAQVNYVLTFHDINNTKEKGALTPYALLHGKEGWDCYERRVKSHSTTLRNKKVQLLLREDAPELVERYTALAETAWISRLAQKVASLHFGWRNGIDYGGKETKQRVMVISGGLTARVRRKYRLNSLLAPCPQGADPVQWEEKVEKNRDDDRHHALDAMVINFLENWVRNPSKEHWFRFPPEVHRNAKAFFAEHLEKVTPEPIATEKPVLEEKFYAERVTCEGKRKKLVTKAARRLERIIELPYKTENMRRVYDSSLKTAMKRVENIRDDRLREIFRKIFIEQRPDESSWAKLCEEGFFQLSRAGRRGSKIRRLMLDRGTLEEYRDMSKDGKDGRPALRRGEPHRGFLIFWNAQKELNVRPVYAHESPAKVQSEVAPRDGAARVVAFVFSGCLIETATLVPKENVRLVERNESKQKRRIMAPSDLPAGRYILRQIVTRSHAVELDTPGGKRIMTEAEHLVKAGLKFVRTA